MEKVIKNQFLTGERALFGTKDAEIYDTIFTDGESPLKESSNIGVYSSMFKWKYPLWYCRNISVRDSAWFDMARAGVWYTDNISVEDYFAMNCENVEIDGLTLYGNYSFDGVKNMTVKNSKLLSKDAFWNSDNVTVYDSFISGEYLGWNAKNLTLVNCTVESLQGMCYIDDLVMKNCKLINTTLAFEYSTVQADISGSVNSVINPKSGTITAESIGELIMEKDKIDPTLTKIICRADKAVNV